MKRYCSSRAEAALAEMQIKGIARRNFHRAQRRRLALPSAEGPFARCRAASPAMSAMPLNAKVSYPTATQ